MDVELAEASAALGVDIEEGLLNPLGDEWLIYADAAAVGIGALGFTAINHTRDADGLNESLIALERIANAQMAESSVPGGPQFQFQLFQQDDLAIHSLVFPMLSPSWAMHENYLMFGLFPQTVVSAADQTKPEFNSILDNPQFTELVKHLGDRPALAISYIDLPTTVPQMYQTIMMGMQMLAAMAPQGGLGPQLAMMLPPLNRLMPHLKPAAAIAWADSAGYHSKSISPFPGSTMLSPNGNLSVSQVGLATGVLLPALGSARKTARRMQGATQVRGIHQGCVIYAQGADGRFPDDIGTLYINDLFPAEYVLSPMSERSPPADIDNWPDEQKRQWVNENTSFVLVPGLTDDVDEMRVAVFTKLQDCGGEKISIGYNDNHVVMVPIAEARLIIKENTGISLEAWCGLAEPQPQRVAPKDHSSPPAAPW